MKESLLYAMRRVFTVCGVSMLFAATAGAASFPERPVKIVVPQGAGSSMDIAGRLLADNLSRKWGQQAYVFNQPGGSGAIAAKAVAGSPPNGETLLFTGSSIFMALPVLQPEVAGVVDSLMLVAYVGEQPFAVVVSADNPARNLGELIEAMRKTPGGMNCAVTSRGGLTHLSGEMLKDAVGADMNFIFYSGGAQSISDLIAGRVPMVIDGWSAFLGPASSGQVRILGIGSKQRVTNLLPNVPTIAETVPGFEAIGWLALTAPPGTPAPILAQIKRDVDEILADPAVAKKLEESGTLTRRMSDTELAEFFKAQKAKWLPIAQKHAIAK